MERKEELKHQLQKQVKSMIPSVMNGEKIGSLIFWYDEYGAFVRFAKWKNNEFSWSFPVENNINLEKFDVFDDDEIGVINDVVEKFYHELRSEPSLLQLPLRKGFQFCLFNSQVGEPLDGIEDEFNYSLEESIDIITQYINKSFIQKKVNNLEEISFSSEEQKACILLSGSGQYDHYSYGDSDIGFAFTKLIQSAEDNFYRLCENIIQSEEFRKTTKNDCVEFQIFINEEEFFTTSYKTNSGKLTKIS